MIEKWDKDWNYEEKLKDNFLNKHGTTWRLKPENLPEEMYFDSRFTLKGQNINGIEVLYPCARNKRQDCLYVCKCSCGNYFLTLQRSLKEKRVHSCGCKFKEMMIKAANERGTRIDLIGKTYGKLTVIALGVRDKNGQKWLCKCECGNEVEVLGSNLTKGNTSSCGCLRYEKPNARKDLTGFKKGRLTVIGNPRIGPRGTLWQCRCECGSIVDKYASDLTGGNVSSCGCLKAELIRKRHDLTGQRFGKLTVIKDSGQTDNFGQILWECQCDCGNKTLIRAGNLVKGNTTSCGCINSRGNTFIRDWLKNHNIKFEQEVTFDDCLSENGYNMRYDFKIYNIDSSFVLLEYDGNIHFEENIHENGWNTTEAYNIRHNRDELKNKWAKEHNIILYRISYKENIEKRLEEIINELRC